MAKINFEDGFFLVQYVSAIVCVLSLIALTAMQGHNLWQRWHRLPIRMDHETDFVKVLISLVISAVVFVGSLAPMIAALVIGVIIVILFNVGLIYACLEQSESDYWFVRMFAFVGMFLTFFTVWVILSFIGCIILVECVGPPTLRALFG